MASCRGKLPTCEPLSAGGQKAFQSTTAAHCPESLHQGARKPSLALGLPRTGRCAGPLAQTWPHGWDTMESSRSSALAQGSLCTCPEPSWQDSRTSWTDSHSKATNKQQASPLQDFGTCSLCPNMFPPSGLGQSTHWDPACPRPLRTPGASRAQHQGHPLTRLLFEEKHKHVGLPQL